MSVCDEVLYGGAAGGGKSEALLMGAAQFAEVPRYAALLLRRSFADLSQPGALIDRSREWWTGKAKWNGQEHKWTFPSGAIIQFGYMDNEDDKYRYQSAEFQFIGFDELTQFTETQYVYLFSRLRRLAGSEVPLRMRSASNPGGIGHDWVKKRFVSNPEEGRVFLPAQLKDNPSLDAESYRQKLAHLDPITREQYLNGDWDAIASGYFKREWFRYFTRHGTGYALDGKIVPAEKISPRARFLTVDHAATVKRTVKDDPDWSVVSAWAITPCGNLLWLGCDRFRAEVPDIPPRIAQSYLKYDAGMAWIEGGGTQKATVQLARRHRLGPNKAMNVSEVTRSVDKLQRAAHILNAFEAGRVWVPAPSADPSFPLEDVQSELLRFTGDPKKDSHDDIVDTASDAGWVLMRHSDAKETGFKPYVISN